MLSYYGNYCKKCGQPIIIEDIDYSFRGCQDELLYCEKCKEWIFVKVRYNQICRVKREKGD